MRYQLACVRILVCVCCALLSLSLSLVWCGKREACSVIFRVCVWRACCSLSLSLSFGVGRWLLSLSLFQCGARCSSFDSGKRSDRFAFCSRLVTGSFRVPFRRSRVFSKYLDRARRVILLSKKFSELCPNHARATETVPDDGVVLTPGTPMNTALDNPHGHGHGLTSSASPTTESSPRRVSHPEILRSPQLSHCSRATSRAPPFEKKNAIRIDSTYIV